MGTNQGYRGYISGSGYRSGLGIDLGPTYISQLSRFVGASSHVNDFNNRHKFLTAKLLK